MLNYYEDYDLSQKYASDRAIHPDLSTMAVQGIAYCTAVFDAASRYSGSIGRGVWRGTVEEMLLRTRTAVLNCDFWAALRLTNYAADARTNFVAMKYRDGVGDIVFEDPEFVRTGLLTAAQEDPAILLSDAFAQVTQAPTTMFKAVQLTTDWLLNGMRPELSGADLRADNFLLLPIMTAATGYQIMLTLGKYTVRSGRPRMEVTFRADTIPVTMTRKKLNEQKTYQMMDRAQRRYLSGFSLFLTGVTEVARAVEAHLSDAERDVVTNAVHAAIARHAELYESEEL